MLFVQGFMAWVYRVLSRVPRPIRYRLISLCGFILLVTPLALWISMTLWGMRLVLAIWLGAMLVLSLMIWSSPDERI
jgi:hypothetical protein